jgi:hypothetical protein
MSTKFREERYVEINASAFFVHNIRGLEDTPKS